MDRSAYTFKKMTFFKSNLSLSLSPVVFRCSDAFNMDTENPLTFNGSRDDFFGYSVYQYHSENTGKR